MRYQEVLPTLRAYYDNTATERNEVEVTPWKARERDVFLDMLPEHRAQTLLELGSGPGRDGSFFRDHGLLVTCTDLFPAMVERCRAKDLEAYRHGFSAP